MQLFLMAPRALLIRMDQESPARDAGGDRVGVKLQSESSKVSPLACPRVPKHGRKRAFVPVLEKFHRIMPSHQHDLQNGRVSLTTSRGCQSLPASCPRRPSCLGAHRACASYCAGSSRSLCGTTWSPGWSRVALMSNISTPQPPRTLCTRISSPLPRASSGSSLLSASFSRHATPGPADRSARQHLSKHTQLHAGYRPPAPHNRIEATSLFHCLGQPGCPRHPGEERVLSLVGDPLTPCTNEGIGLVSTGPGSRVDRFVHNDTREFRSSAIGREHIARR
jgi:hypothetical protein